MEKVKIFISWSGQRSRAVAVKLRDWIPSVIQSVDPWISAHDIDAGARWGQELETALKGGKFGLICLTRGNLKAEWLHFEAGAISKTVLDKRTMVCPYLIGIEPADVPPGPLTQFQAKRADKEGTFEVLSAINKTSDPELSLTQEKLRISFEKWWPELETYLQAELPSEHEVPKSRRNKDDVAEETLDIVRDISRRLSQSPDPSSIVTVKSKSGRTIYVDESGTLPFGAKEIEHVVLGAGLTDADASDILNEIVMLPSNWSRASVARYLDLAISVRKQRQADRVRVLSPDWLKEREESESKDGE